MPGSTNGEARSRSPKRSPKKEKEERSDACRDFMNGICNRGSRCKFYHPPELKKQASTDDNFNFCIDYQNQGCRRENCRFIHATNDDVDRFKRTGDITLSLARAIAAVTQGDSINGIPFCKEFAMGGCSRGATKCRYWHIDPQEERAARAHEIRSGAASGRRRGAPDPFADEYAAKRAFVPPPQMQQPPQMQMPPQMQQPGAVDVQSARLVIELERRNAELSAEVESLKRELQREKERYSDLVTLFRQTTAPVPQQQPQSQQLQQQQQAPAPVPPVHSASLGGAQWTLPGGPRFDWR